jgi:NADH-quinone oxidoreductase subunit G
MLENDIYRTIPAVEADAFFNHCKSIIVLDSLNNLTTEKAHVLIPAATFAEADGTLVNNEGRAQRFFQVFIPANTNIRESWRWLWKINAMQTAAGNGREHHSDDLLVKLETILPQFAGIAAAAPPHDFRIHGEAIPREPHRYSGRTAMLANLAVSEPKPGQDGDSPMTFTMEGYRGIPPSPMIPFFWMPGWNSVQSVNKYQQEIGGALRGGDPGVRLFEQKAATTSVFFIDIPEAFAVRQHKWLLLPQYHVVGSGELSVYTNAIREFVPEPYIILSAQDAKGSGVVNGSVISLQTGEKEYLLPLKIQEDLCSGVALVPIGLPGMAAFNWGSWVNLKM